jgi:8-oxo-dGTP diphosphatase
MSLRVGQEIQALPWQLEQFVAMKYLRVAAGILHDACGRVLISERLEGGPFKGLWEFPGGKIGAGESATEALTRELAEEIGIEVAKSREFMSLRHEYSDRIVEIDFFLISEWRREPEGREGQQLRWVEAALLEAEALLPADKPIVEALRAL